MDMGDGLYGVAIGGALLVTLAAQLLGVFITSFAFLAGQRLRCYLAIVALIILAFPHVGIISQGKGWWGKVFLGSELPEDRAWLAAGYNQFHGVPWLFLGICIAVHAYIIIISLKFIAGSDYIKAEFRRSITNQQ